MCQCIQKYADVSEMEFVEWTNPNEAYDVLTVDNFKMN